MKKFALAAIAALFAASTFAAVPARAEEGMHHRNMKKVVLHRDHGRHEGWRHSHHGGMHKKVVIKHGHGKTVIKKKSEG